jgi:hypothetical protein
MATNELQEQAEREIAEQIGVRISGPEKLVRNYFDPDSWLTWGLADDEHRQMWDGWVRDRCSLLALRKAAKVGFLPLGVLVKSGEVELNDWLSPELKVAIREGEEALRGALEGER